MLEKRRDEKVVLAEHGRWIAHLRDEMQMFSQRLRGIEHRISAIEMNLVELTKLCGRLDLTFSEIDDELKLSRRGRG